MNETQVKRWRLILGQDADSTLSGYGCGGGSGILSEDELVMDAALAAIYDATGGGIGSKAGGQKRSSSSGPSSPNLARWLGDVRNFFPQDIVSVIQADNVLKIGRAHV